jgi:hypothetical protein
MGFSFLLVADFSREFRVSVSVSSSKIKMSKKALCEESVKIHPTLCNNPEARRSRLPCKKKLDAQLILSIFRQPLHVSGVSRPIIRKYNVCIQQSVLIIIIFR